MRDKENFSPKNSLHSSWEIQASGKASEQAEQARTDLWTFPKLLFEKFKVVLVVDLLLLARASRAALTRAN